MTKTCPLDASNIEMFHSSKMPHFICYFELYNQMSEHIQIGLFKCSFSLYPLLKKVYAKWSVGAASEVGSHG